MKHRVRYVMTSLLRCLFALGCIVVVAVPAFAQYNSGAPWGKDASLDKVVVSIDRTVVFEDIAHYRFGVYVGTGPYEWIQIHRVVREGKQLRPKGTVDGVFLLPGTPQLFEGIFMPPLISAVPPRDHSFAIYLAKNNIDVWGMDWGWSFVPSSTTDFGFMQGWGVDKDAEHVDIALSIARRIRTLTGQGNGRLHLLGFSYGVFVAYAVVGEETQRPPGHRNVKGLIPVDSNFKVSTDSARLANGLSAVAIKTLLDDGVFQIVAGLVDVGLLARSSNNYQPALAAGIPGFVSGYGAIGEQGLNFTDPWLWVDLLVATPYFRTQQAAFDMAAVRCDSFNPYVAAVKFDDHLGKIAVPIFYVGKNAVHGLYAATLTASNDVTQLLVNPPLLNLAHGDLFLAWDAPTVVWSPILDWILAHKSNPEPY